MLTLRREALIPLAELERVERAALRLLEEVGIAVLEDAHRQALERLGFHSTGNRVIIEEAVARRFLDSERPSDWRDTVGTVAPIDATDTRITLDVSWYPLHVHDVETDRLVPFTTERLIEACKLVDALADRGVVFSPPGTPTDVPPALQPVLQYWIAATYARGGRRPIDAKAEVTMPYVMEMADILGQPITHLPVYIFSPLTLGGESLRCVLRFRERLHGVGISSMPSAGCTAHIELGDALALATAEVIGPAILVRELTGLPVYWHVGLFPIDLRTMAMVFGSPEGLLFEWLSREAGAYFHGRPWRPGASNIHSNAKVPGAQASAEKMSVMLLGALMGDRHFGSAGTISLDEVFSAEQLVYDVEIKDHVERLLRGVDAACDSERCLRETEHALVSGSFLDLESTTREYRRLYWHPALFDRQFVGAWMSEGQVSTRERAHAMVRELVRGHDYHLEPDLQRAIDGVLAQAKARLG